LAVGHPGRDIWYFLATSTDKVRNTFATEDRGFEYLFTAGVAYVEIRVLKGECMLDDQKRPMARLTHFINTQKYFLAVNDPVFQLTEHLL
jgi:hypothetical protein